MDAIQALRPDMKITRGECTSHFLLGATIPRALNRLPPYMSLARRCQFLNLSLAKGMGLCGPNRSNSRNGSSSLELHRCLGSNGNWQIQGSLRREEISREWVLGR